MHLRRLFAVNLVFALFFGLTCTFAAGRICAVYGLTADTAALWTTRLLGGSLLGFATLMWFGWRSAPPEARRAIARALLVQDCVGLGASLLAQASGELTATGWSNIGLYGLLAIAYAGFLFLAPGRT
jgi:ferric-dicitrate binding protein FerR (iron transport regulator)